MPPLRLFIAADLSSEQRSAAAQLIENLRKGVQFTKAYPKWVKPEGMHLTLKFLGNVDSERVGEIVSAVDKAIAGAASFPFDLRGLGAFPSERQPKVLWVGAKKGAEDLGILASGIERALRPLGFPPEQRPFHAHLTLARIKSLRDVEAMMQVVRSHGKHSALGEAEVDRVTLYKSDLSPQGATYTALHRWPLSLTSPRTSRTDSEPAPDRRGP
ncbi:MAG TPA: RNA 2',3'-cyclic phosphodiesterase [Sumerlaeia bacterium]|nr:RNA 2',3'-cyclic phosphodiesterase [Sumerlaeia bacterium]